MQKNIPFLFFALFLLASGCAGTSTSGTETNDSNMSKTVQLTILPYKMPCVGEGIRLCILVKENAGEQQFFYNAIEGFNYEWGYTHELLVRTETIENPAADGSSIRYKLEKVVSKTAASAGTEVDLPHQMEGEQLIQSSDTGCTFFGDVTINTNTTTCDALSKAVRGYFELVPGKGLSLLRVE